ncbi:hypothetical protein G6F56_009191 [Rhizopus delemar]|uniref:Yeast cell wall synthesis Kre9/Knh1-like N-terminal domain-containing protein n=1 Tax=Rhizopus stolonifer TaxID=4846 RepID=A0A367KUS6_RHIST|nr:hypothetical protein G6F56_009191 [Rhizopus delemar]RCI05963.1 hypothetical protein CU098_005156 [Rhizopus stolonifer]
MKFSIATLFATAFTAVCAQTVTNAGVAVNHPGYGDVITAGQPFTLTWTVTSTAVTAINSIALMTGTSTNLQTYTADILSAPIAVSPATYTWNVPSNIETGSAYALAFKGANGLTTYSTYFTIIGAAPGTTNNTASTTSAVAAAGTTVASGSSAHSAAASASASGNSTVSSKTTSAATSAKAGMMGIAGVAVALLL